MKVGALLRMLAVLAPERDWSMLARVYSHFRSTAKPSRDNSGDKMTGERSHDRDKRRHKVSPATAGLAESTYASSASIRRCVVTVFVPEGAAVWHLPEDPSLRARDLIHFFEEILAGIGYVPLGYLVTGAVREQLKEDGADDLAEHVLTKRLVEVLRSLLKAQSAGEPRCLS